MLGDEEEWEESSRCQKIAPFTGPALPLLYSCYFPLCPTGIGSAVELLQCCRNIYLSEQTTI